MRKTLAMGMVLGSVVGGVIAVGPAHADTTGELVITFNKKTWNAIDSQMMVKTTGKATPVNARSFGFPASYLDQYSILSRGGLAFVRADASLSMRQFAVDLENDVVAARIVGVGLDDEVFDLANVKSKKQTLKAKLNLAMGQAADLNEALKTDIFRDGMRVGSLQYNGS